MLREQLEQAGLANEALSRDIRRLTSDWTKAREELEQKESDWRREEEVGDGGERKQRREKCEGNVLFLSPAALSHSTATSAASTVGC